MKSCLLLVLAIGVWLSRTHAAELLQVTNHFDADPGWEGFHNRVRADNPTTKVQAFGWSGRIGVVVLRSRTPAWCAAKVGPFNFNDPLTASGSLMLVPRPQGGGAYFGFFNHQRQEWRPWSSIAARISETRREPGGALS